MCLHIAATAIATALASPKVMSVRTFPEDRFEDDVYENDLPHLCPAKYLYGHVPHLLPDIDRL